MPSALKFVIGGDASPFQGELKRMEEMAARTGQKVGQALSANSTVHAARDNPSAKEKYFRDYKELLRRQEEAEVASAVTTAERSNRARMLRRQRAERDAKRMSEVNAAIAGGSIPESWQQATLLQQRQRSAAVKFGAGQMQLVHSLRATFDSLASGANPFTVMLQQIPQMIQGFAMMKGGVSGFVKSLLAMRVGFVGLGAGLLTGIVAGAVAAYKLTETLVAKFSGLKLPEINLEYIPKHLKAVNAIAEMWTKIGLEVAHVSDEYGDAASAAERIAKTTSETYDHRRKLLAIEKEEALARARTPQQKASVEKAFSKREMDLNKEQRQAELNNKVNEKANLEKEGDKAANKASQLLKGVHSEKFDEAEINKFAAYKKAADDAAAALSKSKEKGYYEKRLGIPNRREIVRGYNSVTNSGYSTSDLDGAEKRIIEDQLRFKAAYEAAIDRKHSNDVVREHADYLAGRAAKAYGGAAKVGGDIEQKRKDNERQEKEDKETHGAKSKLAEADALKGINRQHLPLNSMQRIGAYAAAAPDAKTHDLLKIIAQNTKPHQGHKPVGLGGAKFGGIYQ